MIILFLPDSLGPLSILRGSALEPSPMPVPPAAPAKTAAPPAAPPPPDLMSLSDRNELYLKSVALAAACLGIPPGGAQGGDNGEFVSLSMSIHENTLAMARTMPGVPASAFCDALEAIRHAIMTTPTGGTIVSSSANLEHIRRSLTMLMTEGAAELGVVIADGHVLVDMPTGGRWSVELAKIANTSALVQLVKGLSAKRWVSRSIISRFVTLVCEAKGWEGYDLGPEHNQERAG